MLENEFENVVCQAAAILSRLQCVKVMKLLVNIGALVAMRVW